MDHLSTVTEVFQHAVRESTKYIFHQRRTFKQNSALIILKRIEKKFLNVDLQFFWAI